MSKTKFFQRTIFLIFSFLINFLQINAMIGVPPPLPPNAGPALPPFPQPNILPVHWAAVPQLYGEEFVLFRYNDGARLNLDNGAFGFVNFGDVTRIVAFLQMLLLPMNRIGVSRVSPGAFPIVCVPCPVTPVFGIAQQSRLLLRRIQCGIIVRLNNPVNMFFLAVDLLTNTVHQYFQATLNRAHLNTDPAHFLYSMIEPNGIYTNIQRIVYVLFNPPVPGGLLLPGGPLLRIARQGKDTLIVTNILNKRYSANIKQYTRECIPIEQLPVAIGNVIAAPFPGLIRPWTINDQISSCFLLNNPCPTKMHIYYENSQQE